MKTLKLYCEGVLDSFDKKVDVLKDTLWTKERHDCVKKLKTLIGRNYRITTDDSTYQEIVDNLVEIPSEDRKGKIWKLVLPDKESYFKPIMLSLAHGVWRLATNKELCGTTYSAMEKRIKSHLKDIKDYNDLLLCTIPSVNFEWIALNYDRVDSIGSGWITAPLIDFSNVNGPINMVSFSMDSKQWCYGCPSGRIPNEFKIGKDQVDDDWVHFSNALFSLDFNRRHICKWDCFNKVKTCLSKVDIKQYKKSSNDWIKLELYTKYLNDVSDIIYINKKNLTYVSQRDTLVEPKSNSIKDELKRLENGIGGEVSDETMDYILKNFTKVGENDTKGLDWVTIHRKGSDYKYGRLNVCMKTKEWRNLSFSEFYDGGIVD